MSNYFQSLKRLESENARERATPQAPAVVRIEPEPTEPESVEPQRAKPVVAVPMPLTPVPTVARPAAMTDERLIGGYATLFDNLRVLGNGVPLGAIVIAGASDFESSRRVADGLANEVIRNRLTAAIAELSRAQSQPTLRMRMTSSPVAAAEPSTSGRIQLDLRSGPIPPSLDTWLSDARARHDVVVIEAPPLGLSVDAAVVARACDGLILVVEPRATASSSLLASVERAEAVGCRILGIVTQGKSEKLPAWIRQLIAQRTPA
jgi:PHD/YefM family antitoxin component YafN of YafNO toxin-antitoxin module